MGTSNRMGITFHDVVLEIESDCEDFLRNVASHLPDWICTPNDTAPHIKVRLAYLRGTAKDHSTHGFEGTDRLERIGYWTFRASDRI
ncbi:MAG: hypothetical protein ACE5JU_25835, partial [Candidatus Binatia bacterium]